MDKKKLFLWSLYDFANSIIYVNFVLYFAVWIVVDAGLSDFWYNAIFAISSVMLLATAPALAARTDRRGGRKLFLNLSTVGTFVGYGLAALFAHLQSHVLLVALMFLIGQYFYQMAFVFLNPMVEEIADQAHRSRASGVGQFSSSLGFLAGLALTLPFAASRTAPLLVSVVAFFILALPMMFFYKESKRDQTGDINASAPQKSAMSKRTIAFFAASAATPMLVAFFFFSDALVTLSNNYSIYLERVFHSPDSTKSYLLAAVLGTSAIGAIIGGWAGDKIGPLKTLKIILLSWIIMIPAVAVSPNLETIVILTPITGLLLGALWTVSRSYLSMVLSKEEMGYGFSFYAIAERFATLVGPLTWGAIIWAIGTHATAYRIAMASMAVYIIFGLLVLYRWRRGV